MQRLWLGVTADGTRALLSRFAGANERWILTDYGAYVTIMIETSGASAGTAAAAAARGGGAGRGGARGDQPRARARRRQPIVA